MWGPVRCARCCASPMPPRRLSYVGASPVLALLRPSDAPTPRALGLARPDPRLSVDNVFTRGPRKACFSGWSEAPTPRALEPAKPDSRLVVHHQKLLHLLFPEEVS